MTNKEILVNLREENYQLWHELYNKAWEEISNEHEIFCVCGKLCTGLHERNCDKFRNAVDKRIIKLLRNRHNSTHVEEIS